jgi:phosphatidylserine/phosphatidylglycerophosphate/cardiolipin synthase-like enzyme
MECLLALAALWLLCFGVSGAEARKTVGVTKPSSSVSSGELESKPFQTLIAAAKQSIYISTPYFLPDRSAQRAIARAVRDRNIEVKILLTPGPHTDHFMTRESSRRL